MQIYHSVWLYDWLCESVSILWRPEGRPVMQMMQSQLVCAQRPLLTQGVTTEALYSLYNFTTQNTSHTQFITSQHRTLHTLTLKLYKPLLTNWRLPSCYHSHAADRFIDCQQGCDSVDCQQQNGVYVCIYSLRTRRRGIASQQESHSPTHQCPAMCELIPSLLTTISVSCSV